MKSAASKTCSGSTIQIRHDSSNCAQCFRIKLFYNEFQPALKKLKAAENNVEVCGIITFLEACFKYESISNGEKIDSLPGQLSSKDILENSTLPDAQKSVNYYDLLKSILFTPKYTNQESSVYALNNYSYAKCPSNCDKRKSDKKMELKTLKKTSTLLNSNKQKGKISKRKLEKEVPVKPPKTKGVKRSRWMSDTLSKINKDYEDDIFDEKPFYHLTDTEEIQSQPSTSFQLPENNKRSSSPSDYSNMSTPTWSFSLSPRGDSPTPVYVDDCYNVEELLASRKEAEEYQHSRNERKLQASKDSEKDGKSDSPPSPTDDKAKSAEALCQPSCSYSTDNPLKNDKEYKKIKDYEEDCEEKYQDYDSDEDADKYFSDPEEEKKSKRKI